MDQAGNHLAQFAGVKAAGLAKECTVLIEDEQWLTNFVENSGLSQEDKERAYDLASSHLRCLIISFGRRIVDSVDSYPVRILLLGEESGHAARLKNKQVAAELLELRHDPDADIGVKHFADV